MIYVGSYVNELGNIIDCYEINGLIEHLPRTGQQFYKPIYYIYPQNFVPVQPPPINPPPVYIARGMTSSLAPAPAFITADSSATRSSSHLDKNTYTQKHTNNNNNPDSDQIYEKYEVQNSFKNKLVDKLNIGKIAHEMKIKRYELASYFK